MITWPGFCMGCRWEEMGEAFVKYVARSWTLDLVCDLVIEHCMLHS
jgi:hypothetical protein